MADIFEVFNTNPLPFNYANNDSLRNFNNSSFIEAFRKDFIQEHKYFQPFIISDTITIQIATNRNIDGYLNVKLVNYDNGTEIPYFVNYPFEEMVSIVYSDEESGVSWYNITLPELWNGRYCLVIECTHNTLQTLMYYTDWFEVDSKYSSYPLIEYSNTDDNDNDGTFQPVSFKMRADLAIFDITNKAVNKDYEGYDRQVYNKLNKDRDYYNCNIEPISLSMSRLLALIFGKNNLSINGQAFTKIEGLTKEWVKLTNLYSCSCVLTDKTIKTYDTLAGIESTTKKSNSVIGYTSTKAIGYTSTKVISFN